MLGGAISIKTKTGFTAPNISLKAIRRIKCKFHHTRVDLRYQSTINETHQTIPGSEFSKREFFMLWIRLSDYGYRLSMAVCYRETAYELI